MSKLIIGYIDATGSLKRVLYDIDAPVGSNTRAAQCSAMDRHLEALKGQKIKCGLWSLESWHAGHGKHALLNTGTPQRYDR